MKMLWSNECCDSSEIENHVPLADCAIAASSLININVIAMPPRAVRFGNTTHTTHPAWQLGWLCYITTHVAQLRTRCTYSGWLICTGSSCCWLYIDGLCHCKFHIRRAGSTGSNELFCPANAEGCDKTEPDHPVCWRLSPSVRPAGTFLKSHLRPCGIFSSKCLMRRSSMCVILSLRRQLRWERERERENCFSLYY
jgi:hypothetical protein